MGLAIRTYDELKAVPRDMLMDLACDGDHGLFPRPTTTLRCNWFPDAHTAAIKAGWQLHAGAKNIVLCPECRARREGT